MPSDVIQRVGRFGRIRLQNGATPVEDAPRLSAALGLSVCVKREDLTSLAFGGNKVRMLEFYLGAALAEGADTLLITGSVQSNYARTAAAAAAKLGLACHIQLEERLPDADDVYRTSGNVLLERMLGATTFSYPAGEDEVGADRALGARADELKRAGRKPYVIPLGPEYPPLGALGYVLAAEELLPLAPELDAIVVGSGSGFTHAGLLFGLRALGCSCPVIGICVRRRAAAQSERVTNHCGRLAQMLDIEPVVRPEDVSVSDISLGGGYGRLDRHILEAVALAARTEALILDPTYTGKVMAGLRMLVDAGELPRGSRVLFMHTGGGPGVFAYAARLHDSLSLSD